MLFTSILKRHHFNHFLEGETEASILQQSGPRCGFTHSYCVYKGFVNVC